MRILLFLFFCFLIGTGCAQDLENATAQRCLQLMGVKFDITVVASTTEMANINIEEAAAEIQRIEKMISSWNPKSETSKINKNAGITPVKVSLELFLLLERAVQISEITDGAFDISYASLDDVWKFDGTMTRVPSTEEIKKSIRNIGYQKIILDQDKKTVFLKEKGMKINLGAIGKGYAVDKAKELLIARQVQAGAINASGDLTTWGVTASNDKWLVGIKNPLDKDKIFSWMPIVESAMATTNSETRYIRLGNKKYSHIIDPRTGYPVTGINRVSVFSKNTELCDALATAIFVLGKDAGMALIGQLRGTEVIIWDDANKMHKSRGITLDMP